MISENLPDVQQSKDGFPRISIEKVGVRNLKVPFKLMRKNGEVFNTIANISSYCDLVSDLKGINMSRISRTINDVLESASCYGFDGLETFAKELAAAHNTDNIWIKAQFEYIFEDLTPVTNILSYEPVKVTFESILKRNGISRTSYSVKNYVQVESVEMSLCPCSKEMSLLVNNLTESEICELAIIQSDSLRQKIMMAGFGAHNQRSNIRVKVELNSYRKELMWIEDLVGIIKKGASSPTWSTLKRPDEKYVTEVSYAGGYFNEDKKFVEVGGGPRFVEDISRHVAVQLIDELDKRINDFCIVVNNEESIHSGEIMATSVLTAGRDLK